VVEDPVSTVDLHLHSVASDGLLSPAAVAREAARRGLSGISLTDHDTVAGIEEASAEAARLGLDFLVGAELSANEPGISVHILAYCFDPEDAGMQLFFEGYREERLRRAGRIVERLRRMDVNLSLDEVLRESGEGVPTRAHVGRALVRGGHVPDAHTAFKRYIGRDQPAFVEKRPTPPREVIDLVHAAGGVALLAHPGGDFRADQIQRWLEDGLDGLEILHPRNRPSDRARLERLVRERGLLRGGGSDWHGPDSGAADIGSQGVPAAWMKTIVERCRGRGSI
jgi:predicted metal-dependent phosphoesterase TrpH